MKIKQIIVKRKFLADQQSNKTLNSFQTQFTNNACFYLGFNSLYNSNKRVYKSAGNRLKYLYQILIMQSTGRTQSVIWYLLVKLYNITPDIKPSLSDSWRVKPEEAIRASSLTLCILQTIHFHPISTVVPAQFWSALCVLPLRQCIWKDAND